LSQALRKLPSDGAVYAHETGLASTKWGLAAVAVGPIVGNAAQPATAARHRLVLAKGLDAAALRDLGTALCVDGVMIDGGTGASSIPLVDWSGVMVARLSWSPQSIDRDGGPTVGRTVFVMFGLL